MQLCVYVCACLCVCKIKKKDKKWYDTVLTHSRRHNSVDGTVFKCGLASQFNLCTAGLGQIKLNLN